MLFPKFVFFAFRAPAFARAVCALCFGLALGFGAPRVASAQNVSSVTLSESAVAPGDTVTGAFTLSSAPTSNFTVEVEDYGELDFNDANSSFVAVTVPAGATQGTFTATIPAGTAIAQPEGDYIFVVPQSGGNYAYAPIALVPYHIMGLALSPPVIASGESLTGTITVSAASTQATTIDLSGVVLVNGQPDTTATLPITLPSTVTLPANETSVTFLVTAHANAAYSAEEITAGQENPYTGDIVDSASADMNIEPLELAGISLPASLSEEGAGTTAGSGTVTLNVPAPAGGVIVDLSTLYTSQIFIPSTVTISGGSSSATFPITVYNSGSPATVSITATYDGASQTATTTLTPMGTPTLSFSPTTLGPGARTTGTVTIPTAAGPGGLPVALSATSASTASALTLPASVTIPGGQTATTFTAIANSVAAATQTTVTAAISGGGSASAILTVTPPTVASVTVSPASLIGGNPTGGTVTLTAPAPVGGLTVYLQSSSSAATVPTAGSLTIAAGQTSGTFSVATTPVSSLTPVTLSASTDQTFSTVTQTAALTVQPPAVSSLTLTPAAVFAGNPSTATVTLTGAAPAGGETVYLQSSDGAASVPSSVTVAAGATSAMFTVSSAAAAASTAIISASTEASFPSSPQGLTQTASLSVSTVGFTLTVAPAQVSLGTSAVGTVTLASAAPAGGLVIFLQSSSAAASLASSVTVGAGQTTATFPVTTQAVSATTAVTLSASPSASFPTGDTQAATLTVSASGVSLALSASSVTAGTPVTGTVTLSGAAPAGGETVSLSSSSSAATLPASVSIAAGASSATFTLHTFSAGSVTVTASAAGASSSQTLTVTASSGYTYSAGWNLLSLPYDYTGQSPSQIFGFGVNLFVWSPSLLNYIETPTAPADTVHPGQGYWAYLSGSETVSAVGVPVDATQPYSEGLQAGWNMIGDPFTSSVSVSGLTVTVNTSTYKYGNAGKYILALYGYTPGANGAVGSYSLLNSASTLVPGQGYWIYAVQGLSITFPAPDAAVVPPPAAP